MRQAYANIPNKHSIFTHISFDTLDKKAGQNCDLKNNI